MMLKSVIIAVNLLGHNDDYGSYFIGEDTEVCGSKILWQYPQN